MSVLTELRAALDELNTAEAAWATSWGNLPHMVAYDEAYIIVHDLLTDDTIRALLDVAEEGVCPMCRMRMVEGEYLNGDDEWVTCRAVYHAAIASLVKEADHDRA